MNAKLRRSAVIHREHDLAIGHMAEELAGGVELIERLSRRRFLARGAWAIGAALFAGTGGLRALAAEVRPPVLGKAGQFVFPRLRFDVTDNTPDRWNISPIGDVNLRKKIAELTSINISDEPQIVTLADFDDMVRHPFVFMTSEGYFQLTEQEQKNMREFLERGGFIHADDCVYQGQDRFFRTYNDWMGKMFPDNPMRKIPNDHEIYHIFFDFPNGTPHMQGVPHGAYGLFEPGTGRIMTVNSPGDLHCGWCCRWFTPEKNLAALKMGINIVVYFLSH